jgi:L-Ala-D/L-Glu epimerase
MKQLEIDSLDIKSLKIPLDYEFAISRGAVAEAECLLIKLRLRNGVVGYGEAAPLTSLTGETLFETRKSILQLFSSLQGNPVYRWRYLSRILKEKAENQPAARCALETAILDAFCRSAGIPLWAFLGGASEGPFITDITLPLLGKNTVLELSDHWYRRGFRIQKIKVGADLEEEMGILAEIHRTHPDISFIVDANQAFTVDESILFLQEVIGFGCEVLLFEQPVERSDLEGMAAIRRAVSVPVAADESVLTTADLQKVIEYRAADCINLKIMKSGLVDSLDIARIATSQGLRLMIGGMVESRLAMGCSLCVAAGLGTIRHLDLDTPLIMKQDYFRGGYKYDGPCLLPSPEAGLGIEPVDFLI